MYQKRILFLVRVLLIVEFFCIFVGFVMALVVDNSSNIGSILFSSLSIINALVCCAFLWSTIFTSQNKNADIKKEV